MKKFEQSFINEYMAWNLHDDDVKKRGVAERVRFHKQEDGEVSTVCRAFEEYGKEREERRAVEIATEMIKDGSMSLERIAKISHLPLKQIQQLAEQLKE